MFLGSFLVRSFHFFSKYPIHAWPGTVIVRDYYEYTKNLSMEWKESSKTADTRKTIQTNLFIEIKTGSKK